MNTFAVITKNTPAAQNNGLTPIWSNALWMAFIVELDESLDSPNLPDQLASALIPPIS